MSTDSSYSDDLDSDWLSSLNDSISSDPGLQTSSFSPDNSGAFTGSSANMESGLAGFAAQSPGLNNFNVNANYGSAASGAGGILSGLSGLLASGSGGGTTSSLLNSILGLGSGIYGLSQANNLQGLSTAAIAASNPFGPYRAQYANQLSSLMANPSSIFSNPGYQASFDQGSQAVARQMAGSGYAGSGNEAIALQQYGQSFSSNYLTQQENLLSGLAGANITPNPGPGLSGYNAGITASGNALGSLGYGATMAAAAAGGGTGSGTTANPMGNFSSAGGEAATIGAAGQLATGVSGLYDSLSGSNALSGVGNAAGIAGGIASGTPIGYTGAAINAGQLAGKAGAFGSDSGTAATGLQDLGAGLGIYQGIERGGVIGDTQAATGAARLATSAGYLGGSSGALASKLPIVGAALGAYQFATQDTKSGATGADALGGAETGAEVGSAFGPLGTLVGGVIGGVAGGVASAFGPGRMDPENINWDSYASAFSSNPADVNSASPTQNYQALAGIFDARGSSLPFYQTYGRMGENQFMTDMTSQINQAVQSGSISQTATPQDIYSQVVQPWINKMSPQGWQPTNTVGGAPEQGAVGNLLTNLIGEYQSDLQGGWTGVGGQQPFSSLPSFGGGAPLTPISGINKGGSPSLGAAGRIAYA